MKDDCMGRQGSQRTTVPEEEGEEKKKKKNDVKGAVFIKKFIDNQMAKEFLIPKTFQFTCGLFNHFTFRVKSISRTVLPDIRKGISLKNPWLRHLVLLTALAVT
jgi:hypothetical protein